MVKKIILYVILIILSFSSISQTVQGIGGDIKWTGQKGAEVLGGGGGK